MSIKSRWNNGILEFYDGTTFETVRPMAPVVFEDDFVGQALDTTVNWTAKDTAGATETLVEDTHVAALTLSAANEKQEGGLYQNDKRLFVLNQGLNAEFRIRASVLPTGQAELYFGLAGDYVEGPIAEADAGPAEHMFFCLDGSGAVTIFTDDTVTDNDAVATGVTLLNTDWAICRIDCTDITDVKFFINGNRVGYATTIDMSAVAGLLLQPFLMAHKETGTGVGTLQIDYVRVWMKRS